MVGGSTSAVHATPATTALRPEAESHARRGVVTLVYNKRTVGYSTFHHDYAQLGDDALAARRTLDRQPGVDPARSGLWGLSEGAWAVSLAAAKSLDVRFVVTIGAAGLPPARQTAWADEQLFRHAGVSDSMPGAVSCALWLVSSAGLFPEADSPLLGGRTLPWLGLQALAATAVAATVATTIAWWRRRDGGGAVRLAMLLAGGLLFIPWALSWGLLVP